VSVLFWLCVVAIAALITEITRLRHKIKILHIRDADRLLEIEQINQMLIYGKEKHSAEEEGAKTKKEKRRSDNTGRQSTD